MNKEPLSYIFSYIQVYKKLVDAEDDYIFLKTFENQSKMLQALKDYDRARTKLFDLIDPVEVVELLTEMQFLNKMAVEDIKNSL